MAEEKAKDLNLAVKAKELRPQQKVAAAVLGAMESSGATRITVAGVEVTGFGKGLRIAKAKPGVG